MTTQALCMWTTGEALTEIARDFVRGREYDRASRFLVEGLDGMSFDIAHMILRGDACIGGRTPKFPGEDVGVYLDETEDAEWKAELQEMFAGAYLENGKYWVPYAAVTNYGKEDYIWAGGKGIGRALHYADDPNKDSVKSLDVPDTDGVITQFSVLFRQVDIPVWWQPRAGSLKPQEAVADFLLHHRLEYRGRSWRYGDMSPWQDHADAIDAITAHDRKVEPRVDQLAQEARAEREEMERLAEEYEDQQWEKNLADYRARILEQAGEDDGSENYDPLEGPWFTLKVKRECDEDCEEDCDRHPENERDKPLEYRVASAPFIGWCLSRTRAGHRIPPWKTVCPSGLKLQLDNPYHTDWMLSAGLSITDDYRDEAIRRGSYKAHHIVQQRLCEFKCAVLSGHGKSTSFVEVVHPKPDEKCDGKIAVIPSAGPKYTIPAMTAEAVITERGGPLAHLAVVGMEQGIILVRVPDARTLYPEGSRVRVDALNGEVELDSTPLSVLLGEVT